MGSVDFEDASRMDFDRQQQARLLKAGLQHRVNPASADSLFVQLLVSVLQKVSPLSCMFCNKPLCRGPLHHTYHGSAPGASAVQHLLPIKPRHAHRNGI